MRLSRFFIDRPIFAAVLAVIITIVGAVAYIGLPVSQYPDIVPPTVTVTANYPGASAETVADTVAAPIEQEINGVDNMLYMSSQSTGDGNVTITVTFKIGTDLDAAQVLVQNRVAIATPRLPETVQRLGVVTRKTSPDFLMVVNLVSPDKSLDRAYISNYALTQLRDRLSRIDGVGDVREIDYVGDDISNVNWHFEGKQDTFASRGQKLIYHGPLKPLENVLLRSPIVPWSFAASNIYHNWYWYRVHGLKRIQQIKDGPWGRLFNQY